MLAALVLGFVLADPSASAVRVTVGGGSGSGTVVAWENLTVVVTAAHVVPAGSRPTVHLQDGTSVEASVLHRRADADVAVLAVPDMGVPAVRVAGTDPAAGAEVRQWGHAWASKAAVPKAGRVARFVKWAMFALPMLYTSVPSEPGDSGAGVFDARGELVGVCHGGPTPRGGTEQFAVGPGAVRAALAEAVRPAASGYDEFLKRVEGGQDAVLVVGDIPGWYRGEVGYRAKSLGAVSPGVYRCWPDGGRAVMVPVGR